MHLDEDVTPRGEVDDIDPRRYEHQPARYEATLFDVFSVSPPNARIEQRKVVADLSLHQIRQLADGPGVEGVDPAALSCAQQWLKKQSWLRKPAAGVDQSTVPKPQGVSKLSALVEQGWMTP